MSGVHLIRRGEVAELRLDNPGKLNALSMAMLNALVAHCDAIERDDVIRAVVLSAEPARAFCAGADIAEWGGYSPRDFARHWVRAGHRAFDRLARLAKPTVAAIYAHAFGGGLELAAACDARVLGPRATLALPETGLGIVPGWSGTQRLVRLIGEPAVKEMALFGRRIPAERALALGFAAEVADDPTAIAFAMAERSAGLSPRAVEIAKAMIHAAADEDRAAAIEALGSAAAGAAEDRAEGVAAFGAKRPPEFSGR
ncbi:enoyl-CoA hydratase/isomerase family protein [Citreimonas salinaria]|uniref:Enoyl-CoA hydratase/carnithine racemase n=1 Tax=Citreimonas salinaria TaxID=321339 RepID=A0A1H3JA24_9RHOB|nr:enoyl-CoA hydratase/isomerase family protein [Citreimonas salinaria]SDY36801.1 Enoyl-CoA hydratase/carnithine racemase [Citreimonas salinaria]